MCALVLDTFTPLVLIAHQPPVHIQHMLSRFGRFLLINVNSTVRASGKPWASYERPSPEVYAKMPSNSSDEPGPEPPPPVER